MSDDVTRAALALIAEAAALPAPKPPKPRRGTMTWAHMCDGEEQTVEWADTPGLLVFKGAGHLEPWQVVHTKSGRWVTQAKYKKDAHEIARRLHGVADWTVPGEAIENCGATARAVHLIRREVLGQA